MRRVERAVRSWVVRGWNRSIESGITLTGSGGIDALLNMVVGGGEWRVGAGTSSRDSSSSTISISALTFVIAVDGCLPSNEVRVKDVDAAVPRVSAV